MKPLHEKSCKACRGDLPTLTLEEQKKFLSQLKEWTIADNRLKKEYRFKNFKEGLAFVNRIGDLAEKEGHHPDLYLSWGIVKVEIWTHKVQGLTESDFILAAKCDLDFVHFLPW